MPETIWGGALVLMFGDDNMKVGFKEITLMTGFCPLLAVASLVVRVNFTRAPVTELRPGYHPLLRVSTAVDLFEVDCGRYPSNTMELVSDSGVPNWSGPYITGTNRPLDPWGTEMRYTLDGELYRITSAGPDRVFGSEDDIRRF